jgi:hypothetical protein
VPTVAALADSDCELIRSGWFAQPVNTWSSLAYVVAAAAVLAWARRGSASRRTDAVVLALLLVATAVGSVDFHGPQSAAARAGHDLGIVGVLAFVATFDAALLNSWPRRVRYIALCAAVAIAGLLIALDDDLGLALVVLGVGVAVVLEVLVLRRGLRPLGRSYGLLVGAITIGGVVNVLGRTGGALCSPESLLQGHALWHVLTAVAIAAWAYAARVRAE